jgi:hypothetical protein
LAEAFNFSGILDRLHRRLAVGTDLLVLLVGVFVDRQRAPEEDILLYSIGAVQAGVPSHVYSSGDLEERDLEELREQEVVGDIATVFFRADGSYADIPLTLEPAGPTSNCFAERSTPSVWFRGEARCRAFVLLWRAATLPT